VSPSFAASLSNPQSSQKMGGVKVAGQSFSISQDSFALLTCQEHSLDGRTFQLDSVCDAPGACLGCLTLLTQPASWMGQDRLSFACCVVVSSLPRYLGCCLRWMGGTFPAHRCSLTQSQSAPDVQNPAPFAPRSQRQSFAPFRFVLRFQRS